MRDRLFKTARFYAVYGSGALVLGASIIERIDLGYASNPMRVFICLTALPHSHPFDSNSVKSTPGGAYHAPAAYLAPSFCATSLLP
jgi:hypothetical protein